MPRPWSWGVRVHTVYVTFVRAPLDAQPVDADSSGRGRCIQRFLVAITQCGGILAGKCASLSSVAWSLPRSLTYALCCSLAFAIKPVAAQPAVGRSRAATVAPSTALILQQVADHVARLDSLGALAVLDSAIARDRRSGPLWNRYGQIAWGMSWSAPGPVMRPEMIRLRMRADSAFRYAVAFSSDSARYHIDLGRYGLESNLVFLRAGAKGNFSDGLKAAQSQSRADLTSVLTDELGMIEWSEYDNVVHRALEKAPDEVQTTATPLRTGIARENTQGRGDNNGAAPNAAATPQNAYRNDYGLFYRDRLVNVIPPTGEGPYARALGLFREAVRTDSSNVRARRHLYMALADHRRWDDLRQESERWIQRDPDDADALLALGLSEASQERFTQAADAFESALELMTPQKRASFTSITRVLQPWSRSTTRQLTDSLRWNQLTAVERRREEVRYWNLLDPRANTPVNEARVEFQARVAYADLRFSVEEYRVRGADSDRGVAWVRYGPPDVIYSLPRMGYAEIIWVYDRAKLAFVFRMRTGFSTAHNAFEDQSVDSIHMERAVDLSNMPLVRKTWPMRARVARFRAGPDSMDAVVTATVPVRSLLEGVQLAGPLPVTVQLDVHDPEARIVGREVRRVNLTADSLPVGINGTWVRRLGMGLNVVRIDAEQVDVQRAASVIVDADVDSSTGFGISDLLMGTNPQRVGTGDPARWRDISIAPTTAVFPWSQAVGVVWEAYDLTPENGSVRYRIHLSLGRTFTSDMKGFVARIAAYSKNVMERDGSGTGSIAVSYEQARPAKAIVPDFLSVNLKGSVPGTYRLTIEIEDLVSKRRTSRTTTFDLTPN